MRFFKKKPQPAALESPYSLTNPHPHWQVGRSTYAGGAVGIYEWGEGARLEIGAFCSIAQGVQIFLGGEHRIDWVTTYPFSVLWPQAQGVVGHPKTKGDVRIGHDVWIAHEAVILSGVTIGHGAVVGARAVVSKNVAPYAVVAGNPAQQVRMRFEPAVVERLLKLAWWDWPDERIKAYLPRLLNNDIEDFLNAAQTDKTS